MKSGVDSLLGFLPFYHIYGHPLAFDSFLFKELMAIIQVL